MDSRSPLLFVVAMACVLALVACQGEEYEAVTVEERDGITYVINHGDGLWADRENPPLAFELEQVYGSDDDSEAMLAEATALAIDDEGTLYVIDRRDHRLVAFDPDGNLLWAAGRQGEGPGEFTNPGAGMIWDGSDGLYITNQFGNRIDLWRTDGTFVESHAMESLDLRTGFPVAFEDEQLWIEAPIVGRQGIALHRVDVEAWEISASDTLTFSDETERVSFALNASMIRGGNRLLTSYGGGMYLMKVAHLSDGLERVISREVDYMLPRGVHQENGNFFMNDFSGLEGPFVLPGGYLLASAFWAINVRDPDEHVRLRRDGRAEPAAYRAAFDLFDAEGRYLTSMEWDDTRTPEIGEPRIATPDGLLFTTTDDPYPQVRRYRVTVNE